MHKATYNNNIKINLNFTDNNPVPIVKLENELEIPTVPFIWHREESLYVPINAIIRIKNEHMMNIINKIDNNEKLEELKDLKKPKESYIINQTTILESSNYYISYHGFAYRDNIKDEKIVCETIPSNYNNTIKFKQTCAGIDGIKFDKICETGPVIIHSKAFSPPGYFKFNINENMDYCTFLTFGINMENNNSVAVLFILDNGHKNTNANENKKFNFADILKDYANEINLDELLD